MYLLELLVGDVGVDLGGGDGRVAEHGLDAADVSAIGKKIGSKAVTKGVRMHVFNQASFGGVVFHNSLN